MKGPRTDITPDPGRQRNRESVKKGTCPGFEGVG